EMYGDREAGPQGDGDAAEAVDSVQRVRSDLAAAEEERARVVDVVQARNELVTGPFVTEHRRRTTHVAPDGHRPDRELVPRQQVAREREEQGQDQEEHADHPVELTGRLVGAR